MTNHLLKYHLINVLAILIGIYFTWNAYTYSGWYHYAYIIYGIITLIMLGMYLFAIITKDKILMESLGELVPW